MDPLVRELAGQPWPTPPHTPFEWLAIQDVDAHGALFAVDLAMRISRSFTHVLNPRRGMQRRVDQLGAGIGFVVTGGRHGERRVAGGSPTALCERRCGQYRRDVLPLSQ